MSTLHLKVANRGICPEFPHEATDVLGVLGDAEQTVLIRSRLGDRGFRRFRLEWRNANAGQQYEVERLFQAAGSVQTMNYIPPDETAIVEVRFVENTLSITQESVNHYSMSFEVEEILR